MYVRLSRMDLLVSSDLKVRFVNGLTPEAWTDLDDYTPANRVLYSTGLQPPSLSFMRLWL